MLFLVTHFVLYPRICKSTSTTSEASYAYCFSNLQIQKHSERSEQCPLTLEAAYPQAHRAKRAVSIDPRFYKPTRTAICAERPWKPQVHQHGERSGLCLLTLGSTNPHSQREKRAVPIDLRIHKSMRQRAKRAVSIDFGILKSTSTASETSCVHGPSYLQIYKHSDRSELCQWTLQCAKPRVQRALWSLCLWICRFPGSWAQLASLEVLVGLHIETSLSTARFACCACGFVDSRLNGDSSLHSLC